MENYHIIEATYKGPTNTLGSRVTLYSARFNKHKTIPYDYQRNNIEEMAADYLTANGFEVVGGGESASGFSIITKTFKTI